MWRSSTRCNSEAPLSHKCVPEITLDQYCLRLSNVSSHTCHTSTTTSVTALCPAYMCCRESGLDDEMAEAEEEEEEEAGHASARQADSSAGDESEGGSSSAEEEGAGVRQQGGLPSSRECGCVFRVLPLALDPPLPAGQAWCFG